MSTKNSERGTPDFTEQKVHPDSQLAENGKTVTPPEVGSSAPKKEARVKPALAVVFILAASVVALKFACDWWVVGRFTQSTDDAYIDGNITIIAPEVPGFVSKLAVEDNQPVHAGDLLIELDGRDYRAALAKAQAVVGIQAAVLTNLDAQRLLQEARISQAEAEITAAEAEIKRTHDDQIRYQNLASADAASVQVAEKANSDYQQAVAGGDRAKAGLLAARREIEVIATQKAEAAAALEQAKAECDSAQLNLGYTQLRAPTDGTVGNRSAQIGAYATVGTQLVSLIPARGLWVDANFKEDQLSRIHPGLPATIEVDSIPGKSLHGHVVSIAPASGAKFSVLPPENATGNFTKIVQRVTVRIALEDEETWLGQLRPGLSVTASIDTRSQGKAGT